jgi:anti-sigma regulatory factor (Ser/Thr protein kinase)
MYPVSSAPTGMLVRQHAHQRFMVSELADVGVARRAVISCAERLGATPETVARAGYATTELATNLVRHADPGGWILARPVPPDSVEILAVDRGPGIPNLATVLGGDPGDPATASGLAAVRRAAYRFDVHSETDRGTIVFAVVGPDLPPAAGQQPAGAPRHWAGISTGIDEECGDAWAVLESPGVLTAVVVDGLGHGTYASLAAEAAIRTLAHNPDDLAGFLPRANQALRQTRGAVLAACRLDEHLDQLQCLSVGNISGRVVSGAGQRGLISYNGTIGSRAEPPKAPLMTTPWPPGAALVLWSDGMDSRIDLTADADLLARDPALTAAVLYREHILDRDDATVLVIRRPPPA